MNELELEQYGRVARRLDGADERLDESEAKAADELRQLEDGLRGELDIPVPPQVLSRVRGRLANGFRRRHRVIRLRVLSGVAAAAALLLTVAILYRAQAPSAREGGPTAARPKPPAAAPQTPGSLAAAPRVRELTDALLREAPDLDLEALDREVSELEADAVAKVEPVETELDSLEHEFGDLLLDRPGGSLSEM